MINIHQDSQFFPISYLEEFKKNGNRHGFEFILSDHEEENKIFELFERMGINLIDGADLGDYQFIFSGDDFIELEIKKFES